MLGYIYYNRVKTLPVGEKVTINNAVITKLPSNSPNTWAKIIFNEEDILARTNIGAVFIKEGIITELV